MDYPESLDYGKKIIEKLGLPLELLEETVELYDNFKKDNLKCATHYNQEDVIKCIILAIGRKNGYYVLISEILNYKENPYFNTPSIEYAKNKGVREIYKKLKRYLNNPKYMNFNTMNYIDRVGQLLDLQHKDLEIVFANITNTETPVSILAKFAKHLDVNFDELLKIKPTLSEIYIKNHF